MSLTESEYTIYFPKDFCVFNKSLKNNYMPDLLLAEHWINGNGNIPGLFQVLPITEF